MKKTNVELGCCYLAKISGRLSPVRILDESVYGGWRGKNLRTQRDVRIRSAQKLRRVLTAEEAAALSRQSPVKPL